MNIAFLEQNYFFTNPAIRDQKIFFLWVVLFIGQASTDHCDQIVVTFEAKFRVVPKGVELLLKLHQKVVPHNSFFHGVLHLLILRIMDKESVWGKLEILLGVNTPFLDYLSSDLSVDRHVLSNFDHQILCQLAHVASILV